MPARLTLTLQKLGSVLRETPALRPQEQLPDRLLALADQLTQIDHEQFTRAEQQLPSDKGGQGPKD